MDYITLLMQLNIGSKPENFDILDPIQEKDQIDDINQQLTELSKLVEKKEICRLAIKIITHLENIDNYNKLITQPIHINEFKDKNNNKFLQARTTFKNQVGKTKWVNAYVGTFKQYPKGVNDPEAIKKGQILIRQKIKGHFGIK
jgi:hypothetical protein